MREIVVFDTDKQIAEFLVDRWQAIVTEAVAERSRWTLALSGGKTPVRVYHEIAALPDALAWDKAHIFMGDERFVSYRSPRSNFGMVRRTLLKNLSLYDTHVHPIRVLDNIDESARAYEKDLRVFFHVDRSQFPSFDIMVLGIGEDGHTAGLFPQDPALREKRRFAVPVRYPLVQNNRVTVTYPVINNARHIFMVATGKRKSRIVPQVIRRLKQFPASGVKPKKGTLTIVLDTKAAALL